MQMIPAAIEAMWAMWCAIAYHAAADATLWGGVRAKMRWWGRF